MTCTFSSPLTEQSLLEYLDGQAPPEVVEHVAQCPFCADRAAELARFQSRLKALLYRMECPSSLALGEYALEMLPPSQASRVRAHVDRCPHCVQELAQMESFLDVPLFRDRLREGVEKVKVLVARLVSGFSQAGGPQEAALAFGGLRGGEEEPLIYQVNDTQIVLEIQDDPDHPGKKTLLGLITGSEQPMFIVRLQDREHSPATAHVDEIGNFAFSQLRPGAYKLVIAGEGMEIHIPQLRINGASSPS